jgi:hypothetical protein
MVSYDELVATLEDAWVAAGLHEHALAETYTPATHERGFRAELFPEHDELLDDSTMPPWVELTFVWNAAHQLRAEGREIEHEPLDLNWTYLVLVQMNLRDRTDSELVQMFQRAVQRAMQRVFPNELGEPLFVPVDVRRVYHNNAQHQPVLAQIQLVSTNLTDLLEQWNPHDMGALRRAVRREVQLASVILQSLSDTFGGQSNGRGTYRPVETA